MEIKSFKTDGMPTSRWFVFVDPADPGRWAIGWLDVYHVRIEGEESYRRDNPRLTKYVELPDVPVT